MTILILNAGSSSLKYQVIAMPSKTIKCFGAIERIGMEDAIFTHEKEGQKHTEKLTIKNHQWALKKIETILLAPEIGVINTVDEIDAVGHRVVHGGDKFNKTIIITEEVKHNIRELYELAPLHNPANLIGIEVAEAIFPQAKQVAIFDTAFHQTMPRAAYQYAIPKQFLEEHNIRAYGFHGTSHKYVTQEAIAYLGVKSKKIITIHLGNGCSISAIKDGKSIENSMGLGPMNGLVMGTRSGDVDPSAIFFIMKKLGITAHEVNHILQKESGLKGLTGYSDLREIEIEAQKGNEDCSHAQEIAAYRIKKYIGAYAAILNGLDAIIFTAGIGENSSSMRKLVCENLDYLGISLSNEKNDIRSKETREINTQDSKVKILVIPTNEELEIAKQTYQLITKI